MAVATPVFRPKQSLKLAATLYSPPETWMSSFRALRNGMIPGSRRWTRAPRDRKSRSDGAVRMARLIAGLVRGRVSGTAYRPAGLAGGAGSRRPTRVSEGGFVIRPAFPDGLQIRPT